MQYVSNFGRKWPIKILFGISLTTFSFMSVAILSYFLLKKDDDDDDDDEDIDIEDVLRSDVIVASKRITTVQIKVPKQFMPAIIGKGGSVIKGIQCTTNTYIKIDNRIKEPIYSICNIHGRKIENIRHAEKIINSIINSQPVIKTHELYVSYQNESLFNLNSYTSANIWCDIRRSTGAKIMFDNCIYRCKDGLKKKIIIKGTAEQIILAIDMIENEIQEENANSKCELEKLVSKFVDNKDIESLDLENLDPPCKPDHLLMVYVTTIESPTRFWIQVIGRGTVALKELVTKMTNYYNKVENQKLHVLKKVTLGQMVAVKHLDNKWYRAQVIDIEDDSLCKIFFVDYGSVVTFCMKDILELRIDMLSLRVQAMECELAAVKPRTEVWNTEACDKFAELVGSMQKFNDWKQSIARIINYKTITNVHNKSRHVASLVPCIQLFSIDEDALRYIDIAETLVKLEYAKFDSKIRPTTITILPLSNVPLKFPLFSPWGKDVSNNVEYVSLTNEGLISQMKK